MHPCPRGCCGKPEDGPCANKAVSTKRAQEFASLIFMPPISTPTAKKYTKIDPCLKSVAPIVWSFGLFRKAVGMELGKRYRPGR